MGKPGLIIYIKTKLCLKDFLLLDNPAEELGNLTPAHDSSKQGIDAEPSPSTAGSTAGSTRGKLQISIDFMIIELVWSQL